MWHPHVWKRQIVPAGWSFFVTIESAQISVKPVRAARARYDRQIRRFNAKPLLLVLAIRANGHRIADLLRSEQQVILDLLFSKAQIHESVVAHCSCGMAVQAVIDEGTGTALYRNCILRIDVCTIEPQFIR